MAGVTPSQFRLGPITLAELDAIAASNGGQRTTALREAVAQFRVLVEEAGRANAEELSPEDWERLGHLNDPDPEGLYPDDDPGHGRDWSKFLAVQLAGMWEGRDTSLPMHAEEARACHELAGRVFVIGRLRGYALMAALRYFWRSPEAGIGACLSPEVWLQPTKR